MILPANEKKIIINSHESRWTWWWLELMGYDDKWLDHSNI